MQELKWGIVVPRMTNDKSTYVFPIGVGYVSSSLKATGRKVQTLNLNYKKESDEELIKSLVLDAKVDVLAMGGLTAQYQQLYHIFKTAKSYNPKLVTVAGGGIITSDPETAMEALEYVDVGVIGEGEITVCELADSLEGKRDLNSVNGIIFKKDHSYRRTLPREAINDLDGLPYPDYEGLEYAQLLERMSNDIGGQGIERFGYISLSRSCPFNCTFCFHPAGSKYRRRSLESALKEIDYLIEKFNIEGLFIEDELFAFRKNDLAQFCTEIKRRAMKFAIQMRVDMVNRENLIMLRDSGCISISFGLESMDNRILRSMKKHIRAEQVESALAICYEVGLNIIGNFIFGDKEETLETYNNTLNWWRSHPQYPISLHPIIVYPGSELYLYACKTGIIKDRAQFIRDGCPFINVSRLSEQEYRQMLVNISLEVKASEHLENTKVNFIGGGKVQLEAQCPACHKMQSWKGMDTFRNLGLLTCENCNRAIFVVAADYVDADIIRKNFSRFKAENVGFWPMITSVASLYNKIPDLMERDNVFFVDIANVKNGVPFKGKTINRPNIIAEKNITTIFLTSTSPFLVADIVQMIKRDYANVKRVLFIGDLADDNFNADAHNLL